MLTIIGTKIKGLDCYNCKKREKIYIKVKTSHVYAGFSRFLSNKCYRGHFTTLAFKGAGIMYSHYAFISESGNYGFNFDGDMDTNYFVVTAVLMADNNIESVRQKLDGIQIDQTSIESSPKDREEVINQLLALDSMVSWKFKVQL